MVYRSIRCWIIALCCGLRKSQAKTLAHLVVGAMRCRRVSLADIGRSIPSGALVKHNIKRVWRFLRNNGVDIVEGARALCAIASKAAGKRLIVAVDWVDVGSRKVLKAAVPIRGRGVPILFYAYEKWQLFKSQNNFEEGFFRVLRSILPKGTKVVIVADRGFGRAELASRLQELEWGYIIRISPAVTFVSKRYSGQLDRMPVRPGTRRDLGFGKYRKNHPVCQRIVFYWKKKEAEPWFLGTNLEWGWRKIVQGFQQRMTIEELFRDEKNIRYGWGLRQLKVSQAQRLERMLLVLAFAYLALILMGLICSETMTQAHWSSAVSKRKQSSIFLIGRYMQDRRKFALGELLGCLHQVLPEFAEENWG